MYEGDKFLRLYSATGSLSFSRSSRSSFSMASSIDGSVAFLFLNFASCEMLQRFTPHRVCHPNPLRQLWQSALGEI